MAKKLTKKASAKAVTKKVIAKTDVAKTAKTMQKETKTPITKVAESVSETKSTLATTPDFKADIAKTVAKPATTITAVNTDRQRRVITTQETPVSVNNVAELERIYQSLYRRANVINLRPAFELEAWVKKLNPEADVIVTRPRKDVRVQAAFQVTVGEDTRRMPDIGYWSTSG